MKAYVEREYWSHRAAAQGPSYVGPGGDPSRTERQKVEFGAVLADVVPDGANVLDFGCGSGRFYPLLSANAAAYIGVDVSDAGVRQARERYPAGRFDHLATDRLDVPDGWATCVVAVTVFQHIVNAAAWAAAVSEVRRVMQPGGVLAVIDDLRPQPVRQVHMKWRSHEFVFAALGCKVLHWRTLPGHWFCIGWRA